MNRSRSSPRKFSEKIALLNKKEAEHNAEFEKIIKEVELTTRAKQENNHHQPHQQQSSFPIRTSSFSNCYSSTYYTNGDSQPVNASGGGGHHLSSNYQYNNLSHQNLHYSSQSQLYASPNLSPDNTSSHIVYQQPPQQLHHDQTQINHHQTNHNQTYQMQQPQHHLQEGLNSMDLYIQSESNSPGVPNIRISPIEDHFGSNQQVNNYNFSQNNNHPSMPIQTNQHTMSTMSSARSLPDIANLRVSSNHSIMESPITQSYSDERLNNNLSPDYYCNTTNNNSNNDINHTFYQ